MTDAPGHLDLDALADVLAGARDDAHLDACGPCSDRLAELAAADASVAAALGALPAPPVPDGLSARLARALEDERRQEVASVRPLRRQTPAWLPAVAATVVLVTAGAVGWSVLDPSARTGQDAATSAAGGGSGSTEERSSDDSGRATDTAVESEAATGLAMPRPAATDWAEDAARPAALARLLAADDPAASRATAGPPADGLERLRDPAALEACLAGLPGGDPDVLAVDYAQYAGAPAVAVVQPAEPGSVTVTVVGSTCSAADPAVLSELRLPRP